MDEYKNETIEGRNAVTEALRAGRALDKVFIARGETDRALAFVAAKARAAGVTVVECDRRKLDAMSVTKAHQGVVAVCAAAHYSTIDDIFARAAERGEPPLIVACDEISDPHNFGAIIRSAECAGAHGVIIPKRRSAGLTAIVDKTSAGAAEHLPVARVPNLPSALEELKRRGVWIGGGGLLPHVEHGPDGQPLPGHRLGGGRHRPPGARKVRFPGQHPPAGARELAQRLGRGGGAAV